MDFDTTMQSVLEQRKYDALTGRTFNWREQLMERIMDLIDNLLSRINFDLGPLFQTGSSDWVSGWIGVLRIIGIILLIILIIWLIKYIWKCINPRSKTSKGIFENIDVEASTAAELLEASLLNAAKGNQRDAVRYCLAAILLDLDKKKIYRLNYTKTNRQILRELNHKLPSIIPDLTSIVDVFNMVWFGHRNLSDVQFKSYWQKASIIVAEVESDNKE